MKRINRHKVKHEMPEASSSFARDVQEHDLAYYIHDRVELVHQVFSVLKAKDLRAMAPDSVRHISIDDLQELCTEELLGISSKRLCAILDGAEPPSDTESSSGSPEHLETISLDSISSDEEILSQASRKKKKHKHKHRDSKSKSKKKKTKESPTEDAEKSKASRAGLTVLELLELQARARAIRAQLQQEQVTKQQTEPETQQSSSSEDEVEIKEEPAEVFVISSSEDEKPDLNELQIATQHKEKESPTKESSKQMKKDKKKKEKGKKDKHVDKEKDKRKDSTNKDIEHDTKVLENVEVSNENPQKITKKIHDLIITVPQQTKRKIKLKRNKVTASLSNENNPEPNRVVNVSENSEVNKKAASEIGPTSTVVDKSHMNDAFKVKVGQKDVKKDKIRKKKRKKRVSADKDSDHDEITLQLSDSEKMDLLQDFDTKSYDVVSSSNSDDTDSSSNTDTNNSKNTSKDSSKDTTTDNKNSYIEIQGSVKIYEVHSKLPVYLDSEKDKSLKDSEQNNSENTSIETDKCETMAESVISLNETIEVDISKTDNQNDSVKKCSETTGYISETVDGNVLEIQNINDIPLSNEPETDTQDVIEKESEISENKVTVIESMEVDKEKDVQKDIEVHKPETRVTEKDLSEGELSEHESSEVEAVDLKLQVVCISDDEKETAKKKKKDKKKKDKKSKKKDFRESADQNFYRHSEELDNVTRYLIDDKNSEIEKTESINLIDDDVTEILQLSDDSSCYEVEGTVLSKEPTVEEIAALSARIDEIKREDVITEEELQEFERKQEKLETNDDIENISWKDRYLDSTKVKKVLSTSNILNAMRKKNKELKNKLEDKKKQEEEERQKVKEYEEKKEQENDAKKESVKDVLEEGSIEHYNTLHGSTKYVDPVKEIENQKEEHTGVDKNEGDKNEEDNKEKYVTGEMKKDAKQLLKMYKKLIKYNDMNKQKFPNKKKKKKGKKKEA